MEGEKQKQERKSKQPTVSNKQESQHQKLNEASMNQIMQQGKSPLDIAMNVIDLVNKAEIPEYLVHAIIHGNQEIAFNLIQKGVSKMEPPSQLQSSWLKAMPNHNEELLKNYKKTPYLVLASSCGQIQIIKKLLLHQQNINEVGIAGVYKSNYVITNVLGAAAFNNQIEVVKFLIDEFQSTGLNIEHKAQEEKVNPNNPQFTSQLTGCTPLLLALHKNCDSQILQSLVNVGANVQAKDVLNNSVLHIAVRNNNVQHVDFLLSKGAPIIEKNSNGETAESIAKSKNYSNIVQLIQAKGNISQQMAEQLLQQDEMNEQQNMKPKNKNQENVYSQKGEENKATGQSSTTKKQGKSKGNSEEVYTQKAQNQQVTKQQKTGKQQNQQQQKNQAQSTYQQKEEGKNNTLEQPQFSQEKLADKNMQVVGINPQILKGAKNTQNTKNQEPSQNILSMGMKQGSQTQNQQQSQQSHSQQSYAQQENVRGKWEQNLAGFAEEYQEQQFEKGQESQEQPSMKLDATSRMEAEVQQLKNKLQSMGKKMLMLEKDLSSEKKKRQYYENLIQSQTGLRNQDLDRKELLDMCNEQLKIKSQEISKLKSKLSGI